MRSPSQCALQDAGPMRPRASDHADLKDAFPFGPEHFCSRRENGLAAGDRRCLVLQPVKALTLSEHRQHVEDRRRSGAPGERSAKRLGDAAELDALAFGEGAHGLLSRLRTPRLDRLEVFRKVTEEGARVGCQQARRALVERQRAVGYDEAGAVRKLDQEVERNRSTSG